MIAVVERFKKNFNSGSVLIVAAAFEFKTLRYGITLFNDPFRAVYCVAVVSSCKRTEEASTHISTRTLVVVVVVLLKSVY